MGSKSLKNPKVIIDYSKTLDDVYENLEDYSSTTKKYINSFWYYDSIRDNKKLSPFVT